MTEMGLSDTRQIENQNSIITGLINNLRKSKNTIEHTITDNRKARFEVIMITAD